jgi:transposase-like protein
MQVQFTASEAKEQEVEYTHATLDDLARQGARQMIALALQLEVSDYVERHAGQRDKQGHRLVVRNGSAQPRTLFIGGTPVEVQAPRVNDRREGEQFTSAILPPYVRRSRRLEEAIPILYLRGLSTGDFTPVLTELFGEAAKGFSPTSIVRFKQVWETEYQSWRKRDLAEQEFVYWWADGVNFAVRLEEDRRLTCLVIVGVRADGTKEVIALEEGYRESEEAWLSVLRELKRRGLGAPALAVGDGALGFWRALEQVYPEVKQQRCWVHKLRNVLEKLPQRLQEKAKEFLREVMNAPDRESARSAMREFRLEFGAKYERAVLCLEEDEDELLRFMEFPAEHWVHLKTTNVIESVFAPAKGRTKKTKGAGSRKAGLAMAYKLITMAQGRWRKINAPHLLELVREGVRFKDGIAVSKLPRQAEVASSEAVAA